MNVYTHTNSHYKCCGLAFHLMQILFCCLVINLRPVSIPANMFSPITSHMTW